MYIQTIRLSVIKRRIFPYEKISKLVLFLCAGVGCWNVNRESKGMRLRNEALSVLYVNIVLMCLHMFSFHIR